VHELMQAGGEVVSNAPSLTAKNYGWQSPASDAAEESLPFQFPLLQSAFAHARTARHGGRVVCNISATTVIGYRR